MMSRLEALWASGAPSASRCGGMMVAALDMFVSLVSLHRFPVPSGYGFSEAKGLNMAVRAFDNRVAPLFFDLGLTEVQVTSASGFELWHGYNGF